MLQGRIDLSHPVVMGILNVTPDSFSDGGNFVSERSALEQARKMVAEGAAIIDIGGESTRPGAQAVNERQELDRVIPVIQAIRQELEIPISIDTSKAAVMTEALAQGADIINDVRALREPGALQVAQTSGAPVCLMHMLGEPRTMQNNPHYEDVVTEVVRFLVERARDCERVGILPDNIWLDPGFGFGKTVEQNLQLIKHLDVLCDKGYPVLIGVSRKSSIGKILDDRPVNDRLYGSLALTSVALEAGAKIVRTHDVKATMDTINTFKALQAVN